ncbi:hypothetical protein MRX96_048008 [Rhipicephalus microplus]
MRQTRNYWAEVPTIGPAPRGDASDPIASAAESESVRHSPGAGRDQGQLSLETQRSGDTDFRAFRSRDFRLGSDGGGARLNRVTRAANNTLREPSVPSASTVNTTGSR